MAWQHCHGNTAAPLYKARLVEPPPFRFKSGRGSRITRSLSSTHIYSRFPLFPLSVARLRPPLPHDLHTGIPYRSILATHDSDERCSSYFPEKRPETTVKVTYLLFVDYKSATLGAQEVEFHNQNTKKELSRKIRVSLRVGCNGVFVCILSLFLK